MAHADAALHQLKAVMEKESLQKLQSVQAAVQRKEAELQVCLMHTELVWGYASVAGAVATVQQKCLCLHQSSL